MPQFIGSKIGNTKKPSSTKGRREQLKQQRRNAMLHAMTLATEVETIAQRFVSIPADKLLAEANLLSTYKRQERELADTLYSADSEFNDYHSITCAKTGAFIGGNDANLAMTIQVHGRQRAHTLLRYQSLGHCHPAWLETSPEARDKLLLHDPIGYFCYAAKQLSERHSQLQPDQRLSPTADESLQLRWDAHRELAQLHHRISQADISNESLIEANRLISHFLGLCKPRSGEMAKIGGLSIRVLLHRYKMLIDCRESDAGAHFAKLVKALRSSIREVLTNWGRHNVARIAQKQRPKQVLTPLQLERMRQDLKGSAAFATTVAARKQQTKYDELLADFEVFSESELQKQADNKFIKRAAAAPRTRRIANATADNFLEELPIGDRLSLTHGDSTHGNKRVFEGKSKDASKREFKF